MLFFTLLALAIPLQALAESFAITTQRASQEGGLYLLGTANGLTEWAPTGPQFNYDSSTGEYYLDVYFKGIRQNYSWPRNGDDEYGHFSLTTMIADPDSDDPWGDISSYRLVAQSNDYGVQGGSTEDLHKTTDGFSPDNAFSIPAGIYRITVNASLTSMSIQEIPVTVSYNPPSGSVVDRGAVVVVSNTILDEVNRINQQLGLDEVPESDVQTKSRTNGSNSWYVGPNGGSKVTLNQAGENTIDSECRFGQIVRLGSAVYTVNSLINIVCTPSDKGTVELLETPPVGQTVTFTVHPVEGYEVESVKVVNADTHEVTTLTPDDNGIYSFERPSADVTIRATFAIQSYTVSTQFDPEFSTLMVNVDGSFVDAQNGVPKTMGSRVEFSFSRVQNGHTYLNALGVRNLTTNEEIPTTLSSNTSNGPRYTFTMPASDVLIYADIVPEYQLSCSATPYPDDVNDISPIIDWYAAGQSVTIHVYPGDGYRLQELQVPDDVRETLVDNGDGSFTFIMPAHDVVVIARFEMIGQYKVNTVVNPEGLANISLAGHVKYVEGEGYFSDAGTRVFFNAPNREHWKMVEQSVVDADGNQITIIPGGSSNYDNFFMPASDVTITANYEPCRYITTSVAPSGSGTIKAGGPYVFTENYYNPKTYSLEGREVTFTLTPKAGWEIESLSITDANGDPVSFTDNGDGTYSLTMPGLDITAAASFRRAVGEIFERVTSLDQIQEGETYILVHTFSGNSVNGSALGQYNNNNAALNSGAIVRYLKKSGVTKLRAGDGVLFFRMDNVQDTTCEDGLAGKAAYFNTLTDYIYANEQKTRMKVSPSITPASRAMMYYDDSQLFIRFADPNAADDEDYVCYDYGFILNTKSSVVDDHRIYLYKPASYYHVTTLCTPPNCGNINLTSGVLADGRTQVGETVTFTVDIQQGRLGRVTITTNGQTTVVTPDADGVYSFEVTDGDVQILAEFVESPNSIEVECYPTEGGTVTVVDEEYAGETVTFTVTPNEHYVIAGLEVTDVNDTPIDYTYNSSTGEYSFEMPYADVIIYADFVTSKTVTFVCDPPEGGQFASVGVNNTTVIYNVGDHLVLGVGSNLTIGVTSNSGYRYLGTTMVNNETGEVTEFPYDPDYDVFFEMIMPDADVTLTAHFEKLIDLYLLGTVNGNSAWHTTGPLFDNDGNNYSLIVYFKGYSDRNDEPDGHGYFVLSLATDENDDWSAIEDQLLVATSDKYVTPVNGNTMLVFGEGNQYANPFGNRFMLEPGIYEIQVSEDLLMMSVKKINTDIKISPHEYVENVEMKVTMDVNMNGYAVFDGQENHTNWIEVIQLINPDEPDIVTHYTATDGNGTREGDNLSDVLTLDVVGETVVTATASVGYINVTETKAYRVYNPNAVTTSDPLEYIEATASPYLSGDPVVVSDELVGVWGAKNILWAKDQGQRSLLYTTPKPGTTDYVRDILDFQHHEWDQSNWVMLDFGALYPNWETDLNVYKAMHEKIKSYVDHKIVPGTIHGTFYAHEAEVGYWYYDKMLCTIELDGAPTVGQQSESSLGYPGFMFDPTEQAGIVYQDPTRYRYNHYVPCNFELKNLNPWGVLAGEEYVELYPFNEIPSMFFLPPRDQEVAQVWGVYMGKQEVDDGYGQTVQKDVFEMLPTNNNTEYYIEGRFVVEDWKYNRLPSNITDPQGPIYGRPETLGDRYIGKKFLFHIAIQYYYDYYMPVKGGVVNALSEGKYLVYPLDMPKPDDSLTFVDEMKVDTMLPESEIESIRYYNVMGQESTTPFDGINIKVIRYKDGSVISNKIYR